MNQYLGKRAQRNEMKLHNNPEANVTRKANQSARVSPS